MEHIITTYGGGELFTLIFNGIAALFKKDQTGMVMSLIRVGLMVGSVYVMILMLFRQQLIEGMRWFLWVVIATNLLFLPKTTIFIHDPLSKTKNKVDNVPYALGAFAGFVSEVGRSVTEQIESVFTLPDYMPYHKTGTVFASALMSQLGQFRIVDPGFKGNMERFVNQCVVYDAMIGHKYTLTDLQNTPDIWKFVSSQASPVLGFLYKEGKNPGTVLSCKEGAKKLSDLWAGEIKKARELFGSRVQDRKLTESAFFTDLMGSAKLLSEGKVIAESAQSLLRQEMMINVLEDASNNKLSELSSPSNYAATKALLQQRSTYAVLGAIAARTLPLFKNVIEALSYALFIFIVILALLPNGFRILLRYFEILAWTQLWAPLYAVLNLVMTLYGSHECVKHGFGQGLTLLNSSAIVNANADMTTLAAWLSISIPFISYGIIKQGAGAFVGLAQHLGSAAQSAASSTAAETVSGNINLGNVSMGTESYQTTSAFQHHTSPTHSSSHFKGVDASGIEQSTFADGTQSFADQAISRLGVQIMGTENTSFALQESYNQALSVAQSKSVAANKATESSLQDSTNFLSQVSKAISSGEELNKATTASEARSLQDFMNYVEDIRQSNNITQAQAVEAAICAKMGIEYMGTGIGTSLNLSKSVAGQEAVESAKHIATQKGYTGSLDKVVSAAQSYSKNTNKTKLAELGEGASASLNRAKSLREEASVAHNQVNTLSKDLSSSQSKSFTINKDLTQDFLNFTAQQPANGGPTGTSGGRLGHENARRILEKGGEERAMYLQRFQEENPQYRIQSINHAGEYKALTGQYETESQKIQNQVGVVPQHTQNTQEVHKRSESVTPDLNTALSQSMEQFSQHLQKPKPEEKSHSPETAEPNQTTEQRPQTLQQQVSSFINNIEKRVNKGQEEVIKHQQELKQAEQEAQKILPIGPTEMPVTPIP